METVTEEFFFHIFCFQMTETDLSSLSVEEIFRFLESNNADVVAEVQAMFHQNLSQTKDGWLVVLIFTRG